MWYYRNRGSNLPFIGFCQVRVSLAHAALLNGGRYHSAYFRMRSLPFIR